MKLGNALRWYFKDTFPHPQTEIVLFVLVAIQYLSLKDPVFDPSTSIYLVSEFLVIPFMVMFNGLVYLKEDEITIFEITLIGSWRAVAAGRIFSLLLSFIPFLAIEAIFFYFFSSITVFLILAMTVVMESAVVMLASVIPSKPGALIVILSTTIMLPLASFVVLQSYTSLSIAISPAMGAILYLLSPLLTYMLFNNGIVPIGPYWGIAVIGTFSIMAGFLYTLIFGKLQFKP
ncbi:MAG: hypothetical protein B2I17_06110 [Thermoplasmatales archaeon B_DKE]|nr:MAG: hypothetical protein B2I17_06110 [Thermoplasmatales archaeon B_DKE]